MTMRTFRHNARPNESGMALVVVLWVITSAALLVSSFSVTVKSNTVATQTDLRLSEIESLVAAGLEIAASHLIDVNKSKRWVPDGQPHNVALSNGKLTLSLFDPNGLVDLNKANEEVLSKLIKQFAKSGQEASMVLENILEFRKKAEARKNRNRVETSTLNPTEIEEQFSFELSNKKKKEEEKDSSEDKERVIAFNSVSELRQIPGMTVSLFNQLAAYVTVYSREGLINPVSAPEAVLLSVPNLTKAEIDRTLDTLRNNPGDKTIVEPLLKKAESHLKVETGPAIIISVIAQSSNLKGRVGRLYVIMPEFDKQAPYRKLFEKQFRPKAG